MQYVPTYYISHLIIEQYFNHLYNNINETMTLTSIVSRTFQMCKIDDPTVYLAV